MSRLAGFQSSVDFDDHTVTQLWPLRQMLRARGYESRVLSKQNGNFLIVNFYRPWLASLVAAAYGVFSRRLRCGDRALEEFVAALLDHREPDFWDTLERLSPSPKNAFAAIVLDAFTEEWRAA